ncbi:MAG: hypothetical protein LBS81_03735 [Endomicrobium sp.]|nr:hypothetical protein [Endomicrobium sp.]
MKNSVRLTAAKDGRITEYEYSKETSFLPITEEIQTTPSSVESSTKQSGGVIWTTIVKIIISAFTALDLAITLIVCPHFWCVAIIPMLMALFKLSSGIYELVYIRNAKMAVEMASANLISSDTSDLPDIVLKELIESLPEDIGLPAENFALDNSTEFDIFMHYDDNDGFIHLNPLMIGAFFFDKAGKNIMNEKLLEIFIKHELKRKDFAQSAVIIHKIPFIENFLVSVFDIFNLLIIMPKTIISAVMHQANAPVKETAKTSAASERLYY